MSRETCTGEQRLEPRSVGLGLGDEPRRTEVRGYASDHKRPRANQRVGVWERTRGRDGASLSEPHIDDRLGRCVTDGRTDIQTHISFRCTISCLAPRHSAMTMYNSAGARNSIIMHSVTGVTIRWTRLLD